MSSKGRKRKGDAGDDPDWKTKQKMNVSSAEGVCIIHFKESKKKSGFTYLNPNSKESTLSKLKGIAEKRLNEDRSSVYRMEAVCRHFLSIETMSEATHGYHRDCYQKFTSNLNRLSANSSNDSEKSLKRSQRNSGSKEDVIFNPDCIFCNNEGKISIKRHGYKTTEGISIFNKNGGPKVQSHAEEINDTKLLTRIRGYNLFSCEAKYHRTCREKFLNTKRDPSLWRSDDTESCTVQAELEQVHKAAFDKVQSLLKEEVVEKQSIIKFSTLITVYRDSLRGTKFENHKYRAWKLKRKLCNDEYLSSKIAFCTPNTDNAYTESHLVYSKEMCIEDAVRASFELGISVSDKIGESAVEIRDHILQAFKTHSPAQKWPPKSDAQINVQELLPNSLVSFMTSLLSGSAQKKSDKQSRLVLSICQDICRAATGGKWNLPKHILLGMTMRHLFRSAEMTVILNRFGHIPDYCFLLELESALAKSLDESSHLLTNNIIRNPSCRSVFHSDFDNFDQYTNQLTGAGSVHRAHGIMMQDLLPEDGESHGGDIVEMQPQKKTGERSYKFKHTGPPIDNLYMGIRKNPPISVKTTCIPGGEDQHNQMLFESLIWIFMRMVSTENGSQEHPGWSGFISILGPKPSCLTTIDYYPVIPFPITENSTISETLRFAEEASKEVGQEYHIVTYDLGVCLKAYPLIWNHPEKYKKHIVLIGTFHIVCAYMKMIGKKMAGSGFSDVLIESGLMSSGSMEGVVSGKSYARAMNCHKVLLEGLEQLLMSKFIDEINDEQLQSTLDEAKSKVRMYSTTPNSDLKCMLHNEDIRSVISAYQKFRSKAKSGGLGPTATLWSSYMDHIWLILSLLHAVKTNNYLEYAHCMTLLPDLFFAFGGQNYARYLTFFGIFLANIDHSHPGAKELIVNGAFSVARSFVPGSRSATDKTIEETMMKHSKSRGGGCGSGMIGILNNQEAYQRWVRTAQERVKYYQATLQMAGMGFNSSPTNRSHKDTRPSEIAKSQTFVTKVIETIEDYSSPFDIADENSLYCLSSGCPVAPDTMEDVLKAEVEGKKAKDAFVKDRLGKANEGKKGKNGEGVFFDTIPRMKLKTMASDKDKVSLKKSDQSLVQYRQEGSFVFNLLAQLEKMDLNLVDLKDFVSYPLTPVPYSIATMDGYLAKTNKAKGFHWLVQNTLDAQYPKENTLVIEDGNAIFHCLANLPQTFADIAEMVFNVASKSSNLLFSTDMYKAESVKGMERLRRGSSKKLLIGGPKTKKPGEWKSFLKNDDNKKRLIEILLEVWSSDSFAGKLKDRDVTLICEGKAYNLQQNDCGKVMKTLVPEIESDQEETDTRVILYCFNAKENGYKHVIVCTPDSDIFFILLSYIHDLDGITVYFKTGKKNKKRLINVSALGKHYSDQYCKALLGLHAFTGCDSTSTFKGKGKVKAIKLMLKDDRILSAAASLGNEWSLTQNTIDGLQILTCKLYGMSKIECVNTCRYIKLTSLCCPDDLNAVHPTKKFDTAFIPPAYVSFVEHCKRANFEAAKWRRSHMQFPLIPRPYADHGWHLDSNEILHPVWFTGSMLPQTIINELPTESPDDQDLDEEEDNVFDEVDYSDFVAEMFTETDDEEEFEGFSDIEDA